jgi:hypothetical protein
MPSLRRQTVVRPRWDSVLFGRPDPDVTGRACVLWAIPVLALALLLGAACSDSKGAGADAVADRPADSASAGDVSPDRPPVDAGPDTADASGGSDVQPDVQVDLGSGDVAPDAATARLCDGTAGARLVYLNTGGGPLWPTFSFSGAYGHAFFVIDGTCHYWAGESYLKGIHTGVLLPAKADQIARDLHFGEFARLTGVTSLAAPDASTRILSDGTNSIRCTADCTLQTPTQPTPVEYQQAFQRLDKIFRDLYDDGTSAALPIRVIATDPDFDSGPAVAWPLSWSPSEVLVSLQSNPAPSAGRLITSATELATLRQLRQTTAAARPGAFAIKVRDAADKQFSVLPRDEAPAVVSSGLQTAR